MSSTAQETLDSIETLSRRIVERLSDFYREYFPESTKDEFATKFFEPMLATYSVNGPPLEEALYKVQLELNSLNILKIAASYCADAIQSASQDNNNKAWLYFGSAQYWLGVANGLRFISGTAEIALSTRGKRGGEKQGKRYEELRLLALELAAKHQDKSKAAAIRAIKGAVVKRSVELKLNMSEMQAPTTIGGWLKDVKFKPRANRK